MIGRRKPEPMGPAAVSVRMLAMELQAAHGWASGTAELGELAAEKVREFADRLYPDLTVDPPWALRLTEQQAEAVLAAIVAVPDPAEVAQEREMAHADDYLRNPELSPAELLSIRGMAAHLAEHPNAISMDECYGPGDPIKPGSIREAMQRRRVQLMEGESIHSMFVADVRASDEL